MNFEDYPLVPGDCSGLGYRIVGHIGTYPVYSHGVNPWRESMAGIRAWRVLLVRATSAV